LLYSELREKIYNWVSSNTTLLVIWEEQNAPRPDEAYIGIKINIFSKVGQANALAPDGAGDRIVKYDEDFTLSIKSYGEGTDDDLQQLKDSLQKDSVQQQLIVDGIAVRFDNEVRDISTLIDQTRETRFIYEVFMSFAHDFTENVGLIEDFEYTYDIT
jgi:hypothetical protein